MTDVVMPGMNGKDLADHLGSLYPDLKTLFMSGYTANAIACHGVLDEGALFIQKPFSIQELTTKVRDALDRGKRGTNRALTGTSMCCAPHGAASRAVKTTCRGPKW